MKVKLRELVRWGLVVGLFVLPLIYWPRGYGVVYELPKIVFVNIWIKILVLMMVLMIIKKRLGKRLINKRLAGLVLVFLIVVLVSLFLGVDPIKSYWGNYYRRQGWWMLLHLVSLSFLVGFLIDKKNLKLMIKAISIGGGLVSLVAVIEGFYHWSNSVSAGFGNPNFLGGYLLVSLPLTIYLIKNAKDIYAKYVFEAVMVLQITAIFLSRSVASVVGLVWLGIGLVLVNKKVSAKNISLAILGFLLLIFGISQRTSFFKVNVAESRIRIINKGVRAFVKRPVTGWGFSNFDKAFQSVSWPMHYEIDVYVDKAHSHILEILVTTGIVGLGIYAWLVFELGRYFYNKKTVMSKYLLLVLLMFLYHSQTNVISISEEVLFWWLMGAGISRQL